ncbi:MAG: TolC family protein, partial [Paucibacter sp.]|nr:TolC family protein [Roseateles sp.]
MNANVVDLKAPAAALCKVLCAVLCAAVLAGCAVGPDYQRPAVAHAERYTESPAPESLSAGDTVPVQRLHADADLPAKWWEMFKSPALDELVRASLDNNPSIVAAQAALQAAEHNVKAQQAAYYPNASVSYAGSRQRIADSLASPASSGASYYTLHTLQLEVSYTPDVFGANRRQVESLQAQADNQRWQLEAAYLSLTSNVVVAVIEEAALREQIDAARRQVELQQRIVASYRRQLELGQVAQTDLIL